MGKLYVASIAVIKPRSISWDNRISSLDSEEIIVQKGPFGYREVFTKHLFIRKDYLKRNMGPARKYWPYKVKDPKVVRRVEEGQFQFIIDSTYSCVREADEKDVNLYTERFETSTLKRYYDTLEVQKQKEAEQKSREKSSKKSAKILVRNYQNRIQNN